MFVKRNFDTIGWYTTVCVNICLEVFAWSYLLGLIHKGRPHGGGGVRPNADKGREGLTSADVRNV